MKRNGVNKVQFLFFILLSLLLCACQKAPDAPVVVSKNDGAFDAALTTDAGSSGGILLDSTQDPTGQACPQAEAPAKDMQADPQAGAMAADNAFTILAYEDSFQSTDGNIEITINDAQMSTPSFDLSVLTVKPSSISAEKAQQISTVLSDGAQFYEWSMIPTKSELEDRMLSVQYAATDEAIYAEYPNGISKEDFGIIKAAREALLKELTAAYESAAEDEQPELCQWRFWDDDHYFNTDSASKENDISYSDPLPYGESFDLMATTVANGVHYTFWVNNRDADDYVNHVAHYFASNPSITGKEADYRIEQELYAKASPTNAQLTAAENIANGLVSEMDIGDWTLKASPRKLGDYWCIDFTAERSYGALSVTALPQISALKSDDSYASNYYYEELTILFSNDGRIIDFKYTSPMFVSEETNSNVPVLSLSEIQSRVKEQLMLCDIDTIFQNASVAGTPASGVINITDAKIGLSRISMKDDSSSFYLVPTLTLRGTSRCYDKDGVDLSALYNPGSITETFLVLNLVDGSVIDVSRGY